MRRVLLILGLIIISYILFPPSSDKLILWAWEYPSDLIFLPRGSTVAYYSGVINITKEGVVYFTPRRQPLKLNDHTKTIPVIRIENETPADKLDGTKQRIAEIVLGQCLKDKKAISCQTDFDAVESEYDFYISLVHEIQSALGTK